MNILVVDDKKLVRDNLFNTLTEHGHRVDCAVNGLDALEKLHRNTYQLCVVDHLMPLMNGVQLTKNLRKNSQYKNIPILFMTTQGTVALKKLPEYAYFSAVIDKPLDPTLFLMLVEQLSGSERSPILKAVNE